MAKQADWQAKLEEFWNKIGENYNSFGRPITTKTEFENYFGIEETEIMTN